MIKFAAFLFFFLFSFQSLSNEIKIAFKINDKILTNQDIEIEYRYLKLLNKNLNNLPEKELRNYAKQSALNELIKEIELEKYPNLNKNTELVNLTITNIHTSLNLKTINDFEEYLKKNDLRINDIEKKIQIEIKWNELIYLKYNDKLNIDREKIKNNILRDDLKIEKLLLKELVYQYKDKNDLQIIYSDIINYINQNSFDEAVLKYSISDSKKNNGDLGWIYLDNVAPIIKKNVEMLNIEQISKPIIIPGGALIIKLIKREFEDEKINVEEKLNQAIKNKINQQLNNFSLLYFNKIKNILEINEY